MFLILETSILVSGLTSNGKLREKILLCFLYYSSQFFGTRPQFYYWRPIYELDGPEFLLFLILEWTWNYFLNEFLDQSEKIPDIGMEQNLYSSRFWDGPENWRTGTSFAGTSVCGDKKLCSAQHIFRRSFGDKFYGDQYRFWFYGFLLVYNKRGWFLSPKLCDLRDFMKRKLLSFPGLRDLMNWKRVFFPSWRCFLSPGLRNF